MTASQSSLFAPSASAAVTGRITRILWTGDNGRCGVSVTRTDGPGKGQQVSVWGEIADPTPGQEYEFEGDITFDDKYKQDKMNLRAYRTIIPSDTHGIEFYLARTAKWVGGHVAKELVKAFGDETLRVLKTDPARVAGAVRGVTLARATEIQRDMLEGEKLEAATIEVAQLLGNAVPASVVAKAAKRWGSTAGAQVRENPYLLMSLPGVGWETADAIYGRLGLDRKGLNRRLAAIAESLRRLHEDDGHTSIRMTDLLASALKLLGWNVFTNQDNGLMGAIEVGVANGVFAMAVDANGCQRIADSHISQSEIVIAARLTGLIQAGRGGGDSSPVVSVPLDGLADDQIVVAELFALSPVMVLTGAPGTGKTYTAARMIRAMATALGGTERIALCAPTGKAARQMTQALIAAGAPEDLQGKTIHRLLEPQINEDTGQFTFTRGPNNPLDIDAVVIDEMSMVDVRLGCSLFSALPERCRVLMVGDSYQLPSVGPGAVLRDLIAAGVPAVELTQIKRNAGRIVRACHEIKSGRIPTPSPKMDLANGENWRHIEVADQGTIQNGFRAMFEDQIPALVEALGIASVTMEAQALSAMNTAGWLSVKAINNVLREILNPDVQCDGKLGFGVGDKVVRTRNKFVPVAPWQDRDDADGAGSPQDDPPMSRVNRSGETEVLVVNGDIGIVKSITDKHIIARFDNPVRVVKLGRASHYLQLAYCLTCHKMQGSEARVIVMPLHRELSRSPVCTREWVYTAFSRAKTLLVTIGQLGCMGDMVKRTEADRRQTALAGLIRERLL